MQEAKPAERKTGRKLAGSKRKNVNTDGMRRASNGNIIEVNCCGKANVPANEPRIQWFWFGVRKLMFTSTNFPTLYDE